VLLEAQEKIEGYREEFVHHARDLFPEAEEADISEVANLAYQIPSEVLQSRNIWGLEFK
jgi:hypothetical protein